MVGLIVLMWMFRGWKDGLVACVFAVFTLALVEHTFARPLRRARMLAASSEE